MRPSVKIYLNPSQVFCFSSWTSNSHFGFGNLMLRGTVSVISSDPPCKDSNSRFTTVPLKALSDQV